MADSKSKSSPPTENSGANSAKPKRGRPENLKPWKPGQSGNPGGRPRTAHITEAYRAVLGQIDPEDPEGRTYAERLAEKQVKLAIQGNTQAAREVTDRVEGRAKQQIKLDATIDENLKGKTDFELEFMAVTGYFPDAMERGADTFDVMTAELQRRLADVERWKSRPAEELYSKPPASSPTSLALELRSFQRGGK